MNMYILQLGILLLLFACSSDEPAMSMSLYPDGPIKHSDEYLKYIKENNIKVIEYKPEPASSFDHKKVKHLDCMACHSSK